MLRHLLVVVSVAGALLAGIACTDSDSDETTTPEASAVATEGAGDVTPAATSGAETPPPASNGEGAAEIEAAIRGFFELTSERDLEGLYAAYSETWRSQCSEETIEQTFAMLDDAGVDSFDVTAITEVTQTGDTAEASADIAARDAAGNAIREYTYPIKLTRENDEWKVNEECRQGAEAPQP